MENVLIGLKSELSVSECVAPDCGEPRAEAVLHRGTRYCLRHLVLSLAAEKKVLVDRLSAEMIAASRLRAQVRDLGRVVERDAFVAGLVRERDEAVRGLEEERRRRRNAEGRTG